MAILVFKHYRGFFGRKLCSGNDDQRDTTQFFIGQWEIAEWFP